MTSMTCEKQCAAAAAPPTTRALQQLLKNIRRLMRSAGIVSIIIVGLLLAFWIQLLLWAEMVHPSARVNTLRMSLKQWWLGSLCRILGLKLHRKGGPWTGPVLMACNHISWLDIPVLGASVPFHFLSKAELRQWPIIGWLAAVTGTLFIRRGSGDSHSVTRQLSNYLSQGNSVLFFPEGTTTDGARVLPFHRRLFKSAISSEVAVQPITLAYCEAGLPHPRVPFINDDALVPHIWKLLGEAEIHVHIHYHPPLQSRGLELKQLSETTHAAIAAGLKGIFPLLETSNQK